MIVSVKFKDSSFVRGGVYDPGFNDLNLNLNGKKYNYSIENCTFNDFLLAESKGKFYNQFIKQRN